MPSEIAAALRTWEAMANAMLTAWTAEGALRGDAAIDAQLETIDQYDKELWYVTMTLDRLVELDDSLLTDERYLWIEPDRALERAEDDLLEAAPKAFELLTAAIAPLLPPRMFSGREVGIRSFVTAEGRGPVFSPKPRMSADGAAMRSMNTFPIDAVRARLKTLPTDSREWGSLKDAAHWYETMRSESDDPLKRFLWGFVALEMLVNIVFKHLNRKARYPQRLTSRFSAVAKRLSPATARADLAQFKKAKDARDDIAHGRRRLGDLGAPSEVIDALLPRYFELAMTAL